MKRHRPLHATGGLMLAALLGACDSPTVAEPEAQAFDQDPLGSLLATTTSGTADARGGGGSSLFDELAEKIPGFGGLYRTGPCSVVVVLTDMSEEKKAVQVVHAALAPLVAKPCPGGVQVSAQEGQFTYLELKAFLAAATPLLRIEGVLDAKIGYALNKLVIVVASRAAAAAVVDALPRLGIPTRAVTFQLGAGGSRR